MPCAVGRRQFLYAPVPSLWPSRGRSFIPNRGGGGGRAQSHGRQAPLRASQPFATVPLSPKEQALRLLLATPGSASAAASQGEDRSVRYCTNREHSIHLPARARVTLRRSG